MSQFVSFEVAEDIDDVTLESESCDGESIVTLMLISLMILSIMRVLRIIMHLKMFLESMMMYLQILLLDLIFHKSQAIIVLMMRSVMK